ncbi:MAG: response regulator transcription factor [Oscillospiraceae bacterium]|nr:response regulator transcription factor [Oscillospiraceae bacterium]
MKTILIIEDDETLNKNTAFALRAEGYNVICAYTVEQAQDMYTGADILLLDIMLPDGSGLDFCRQIRKNSRQPVIFLTSCDDENEIIKGLDSGGDDYITKPFRLRELLSRINAVIRRCCTDMPVPDLTALEQKLFEYLYLNKENYVTREQILAYLWDSKGLFVNDNTLSVNISRLRDKLQDSSSGKIVTKRGLGYKWTQQTN